MLDQLDEKTRAYIREMAAEMRAEIATQGGLDRVNSLMTIGMNDAETALRMLRVMPESTRELFMGAAAIGLQVLRIELAERELEREDVEEEAAR